MPRTSSDNVIRTFRRRKLQQQKTAVAFDSFRFRWETLKRKNLEKLQPDGRPKC